MSDNAVREVHRTTPCWPIPFGVRQSWPKVARPEFWGGGNWSKLLILSFFAWKSLIGLPPPRGCQLVFLKRKTKEIDWFLNGKVMASHETKVVCQYHLETRDAHTFTTHIHASIGNCIYGHAFCVCVQCMLYVLMYVCTHNI